MQLQGARQGDVLVLYAWQEKEARCGCGCRRPPPRLAGPPTRSARHCAAARMAQPQMSKSQLKRELTKAQLKQLKKCASCSARADLINPSPTAALGTQSWLFEAASAAQEPQTTAEAVPAAAVRAGDG